MAQIDDRRRAERLQLTSPLTARLCGREVVVRELGLLGSRVESDVPLVGKSREALTLTFEGEEITVDCTVAHSERLLTSGVGDRFVSGLSFVVESAEASPMKRVVTELSARDEIERLKTIVEASKLINSSIEADSLFTSILVVARKELDVERGTLYFVDDAAQEIWSKVAEGLDVREIRLPIGKGLAGTVAQTGEPVILHDAYADPRFDQTLDRKSGYRTRSMLCVPIRNRDARIVGVLQLLNKKHGSFGPRDIDFLDAISDHMAIAMENATLHLSLIEKDRMERELQLGREIQSRLFPTPPCDVLSTQLAARSIPCFEVGGDYYDFLELPNGDLGLALGDVSGKGVSAALIMSSVQAALRMSAPIENDLAALMTRLNALLFRMAGGRKYVTFFYGRYTPSTGELRYVNAGHNPPFVICGDRVEQLPSTGRPIGILPDARYETATTVLPQGCTMFLYTDGLNEAANAEEEEYGNDRLRSLVARAAACEFTCVADTVIGEIAAFENGVHASDDKTLVVLRRE